MWQIYPGQTLRYHRWGNESVLYNDLTGDTHLLDGDAMAVLHALGGEPHSLDTLCLALGAVSERSELSELLDGLTRQALVKSTA